MNIVRITWAYTLKAAILRCILPARVKAVAELSFGFKAQIQP